VRGGPPRQRRFAAARSLVAVLATGATWLAGAVTTLAASPTPAAGGDPRSSGQGPGLVGDPAFAVLAVLAIGIGTIAVTLAYIRLTGGRRA
jgi:hypothetical protein